MVVLLVGMPTQRMVFFGVSTRCWRRQFYALPSARGDSEVPSSVFRLLCVERAMAQAHVVPRRVGPCHVMVEPQHFPAAVLSSKAASPASTQQDLDSLVVLGLDSQTLAPGRPYILNFLNIPKPFRALQRDPRNLSLKAQTLQRNPQSLCSARGRAKAGLPTGR